MTDKKRYLVLGHASLETLSEMCNNALEDGYMVKFDPIRSNRKISETVQELVYVQGFEHKDFIVS